MKRSDSILFTRDNGSVSLFLECFCVSVSANAMVYKNTGNDIFFVVV